MRAVQVFEYGDNDKLVLTDIDTPEPSDGEVRIRIEFAGINFIDTYMRRGMYAQNRAYGTNLPLTLGMEGSGIIDSVGGGVTNMALGERVAYCLSAGSNAEYAIVPAWKLVKVPDHIPLDCAAALMLQGCTAHYLTHSLFKLSVGQTCLIHAGAGGVGQLLIQIAKALGANVIATAGSPKKAQISSACGADHVILYNDQDFQTEVQKITGGEGVHIVYESVGKATFEKSLYSLRHRGTCALFGASSGPVTSLNPQILAEAGSVFLTRPNLADYMTSNEEISDRTKDIFQMVTNGKLDVDISEVFTLEDTMSAHAALEGRKTTGKLLLKTASA